MRGKLSFSLSQEGLGHRVVTDVEVIGGVIYASTNTGFSKSTDGGSTYTSTDSTGGLPEQPYTLWQVLSLGAVVMLLGAGGMVGYDLARNLWLPEDQIVTSGLLKMILSLVGA